MEAMENKVAVLPLSATRAYLRVTAVLAVVVVHAPAPRAAAAAAAVMQVVVVVGIPQFMHQDMAGVLILSLLLRVRAHLCLQHSAMDQ